MKPQEEIAEIIKSIDVEIHQVSRLDTSTSEIAILAKGGLIKNFEFLKELSSSHPKNYFFLLSSLRGICEDLISISYIKDNVSQEELKKLFEFNKTYTTSQALNKQFNFFKKFKPNQRVVHPKLVVKEDVFNDTKSNLSESHIKRIARENGIKNLPSVKDMAEKSDYDSLYEYIYYMTSATVHFRLNNFTKLCWGEYNKDGEIKEFELSTENQNNFSAETCLCYGTFLFSEMVGKTESILNLSVELMIEVKKLRKMLDENLWPHFLNSEHLNLNSYKLLLGSILYDNGDEKST